MAIGVIGVIVLTSIALKDHNPHSQDVVRQFEPEKKVKSRSWLDRWKQWMWDYYDKTTTNFGTNCSSHLIRNLTGTDLKKIQNERKETINQVCNMCRHKSSMECNHASLDGDNHDKLMYRNLLVDDKHQVCTFRILSVAQSSS